MSSFVRAPRRDTHSPRVSIVIPALNEAKNLAEVLPQLPAVHEVILVDGGSVDGTVATARRLRPDVITVLQARSGKGNALASGLARVTGDVVVVFDADGSADPDEIGCFVQALTDGADLATGSRSTHGGGSADIAAVRAWGDRCLTVLFNVGFGTRATDLCYGFQAFWADLMPVLDLPDHARPALPGEKMQWGDGAEIETLVSCRLAAAGARIVEVPSVERRRPHGDPRLSASTDGLRALRTIVVEWCRFRLGLGRSGPPVRLPPVAELVAAAVA